MLGHTLTAEIAAAGGTSAYRLPRLMIPAALMNADSRHAVYPVMAGGGSGSNDLKDSTSPVSPSRSTPAI